MSGGLALSTATTKSVYELASVSEMLGTTQEHLNTGKAINSPADDPIKYFTAKALENDAADYSNLKSDMELAIRTVEESLNGINSIISLVEQAKGLTNSAKANSSNAAAASATFDEIRTQIKDLADDAKFNGKTLIGASNTNLEVKFNADASSKLTITGSTLTGDAGAPVSLTAATSAWDNSAAIDAAVADIDAALSTLRSKAETLGAKLAVIKTRLDFTNQHIKADELGAGDLTLADPNVEGAKVKALQFRQQVGIQSLVIDSNAQMSVLGLIAR